MSDLDLSSGSGGRVFDLRVGSVGGIQILKANPTGVCNRTSAATGDAESFVGMGITGVEFGVAESDRRGSAE